MDNSRKLPDTVALDEQNDKIIIIDQTRLPRKLETIAISSPEDIFDAIKTLKVRGAPAIGVSAAIGYYIIAKNLAENLSGDDLKAELKKQKQYLASSRPTAVNLFWALDKMEHKATETGYENKQTLIHALLAECKQIRDDDIASCRRIGENGLKILGDARRISPTATPVNSPPSATAPHSPPSTSAKNKASTSKSTATKPALSYRECASPPSNSPPTASTPQ